MYKHQNDVLDTENNYMPQYLNVDNQKRGSTLNFYTHLVKVVVEE